jgi:hypothetical protein
MIINHLQLQHTCSATGTAAPLVGWPQTHRLPPTCSMTWVVTVASNHCSRSAAAVAGSGSADMAWREAVDHLLLMLLLAVTVGTQPQQ